MDATSVLQIIIFFGVLLALSPVVGRSMARVIEGRPPRILRFLAPVENTAYRLAGVDPKSEMSWKQYATALLLFNALGWMAVMGLQTTQAWLPLNPHRVSNVSFGLALNTAVSFMTNTNWQAYSGESTLSYLTQMLGLCVQNFLSAATGMAVLLALVRGLSRERTGFIGNFWCDVVRTTVYILLPISFLLALALVSQGVVQSFAPYVTAHTLEGAEQSIPLGPAASQIAIKQVGTNGGGFFGVNSAHPFENPTPLSDFLEMLAILLIPSASVYMFGILIGNRRHAWSLYTAMLILLLAGFGLAWWAEMQPNPATGLAQNLEGKETRFGIVNSVLWAVSTTAASNGSVNSMHDSFMPLAGMMALCNIMLGEVIFGGVGAGLYGMVLFVLLTVFLAGLMVGRTPEYLGKKIETREITWALIGILAPGLLILAGTALACVTPSALDSLNNGGPHGLTEILYAFSSAANNNGSAFAGLNANTVFYDALLALAMLIGRFGVIIPVLAVAGGLAQKKIAPPNVGVFPTEGVTFVVLLVAVIIVVCGLTFFPALVLGPVVEHFLVLGGRVF